MPAQRRFGMDHEHYDWSPISTRGILHWPQEARVALCVILNMGHQEWSPPEDSYQISSPAGGVAPRPYPDYSRISHQEYGHRVGIFRVLDVLQKYGIRPTVAMDALTVENYPFLVRHCLERDCEIIGHGISASQMITSKLSQAEEQDYIQKSLTALTNATGAAPQGWLGSEYGESDRTPQLLAQAGVRYVCDWTNDEQPYPMKTSQGELYALPLMMELDDVHALWSRRVTVDRYADLLKDGFDTLYRDGGSTGRLMVLNLSPWLIGQPFRIGFLDQALGHMMRHQGVWAASGGQIIDWYKNNLPVA